MLIHKRTPGMPGFNTPLGLGRDIKLPCGRCIGCKIQRSQEWATRCLPESQLYERNAFVTLTIAEENMALVAPGGSLSKRTHQKFMKRLRTTTGEKIRFYMCGEYGETFGRPHFHAVLFNLDIPDKKLWKVERENPLYTSQFLDSAWGKGFASIGSVTFQSAAYVARYVMKKVTGEPADAHYSWVDSETGEVHQRTPEFTKMSLKPGIGATWFAKYKSDVFPDDFVVVNGKKVAPPKFYTSQYEILYPDEVARLKLARRKRADLRANDNTPERLRVREAVLNSRLTQLKRTIE